MVRLLPTNAQFDTCMNAWLVSENRCTGYLVCTGRSAYRLDRISVGVAACADVNGRRFELGLVWHPGRQSAVSLKLELTIAKIALVRRRHMFGLQTLSLVISFVLGSLFALHGKAGARVLKLFIVVISLSELALTVCQHQIPDVRTTGSFFKVSVPVRYLGPPKLIGFKKSELLRHVFSSELVAGVRACWPVRKIVFGNGFKLRAHPGKSA